HCFTCGKDLKALTRLARGLAQQGIHVLRFDMRGIGGSQGQFDQSNFTTNLIDLTAAIETATETLGPVSTLIGHSFGGAASLAIAGQIDSSPLPETRWRAIKTIVSIASPSDTQHLATLLTRMNPSIEVEGQGMVEIGGRQWSITTQMIDDFRSHQLDRAIAQIDCPTLLFHSPVDQTVPYQEATRIIELMRPSMPQTDDPTALPASSLITLSAADHLLVSHPADVELVTQMTAAFIKRHAC
ncbi:MAG: alpha/beta fold hydrolase, partial [Planctomycetota bacterium]